jgi:cellobiose-specific phosphotransferase system component IIC
MAANYPQPMSPALRNTLMVIFGALWLSGCFWLVLHYFFSQSADWGTVQHPWSPTVLKIHGWIAVASVFLLGWVTARHVSDRWSQTKKRVSGLGIVSVAAILAVTGYALYYTTDRLHDDAALIHEVFGGVAILLALVHWRRRRPVRQAFMPGSLP